MKTTGYVLIDVGVIASAVSFVWLINKINIILNAASAADCALISSRL